MLLARSIGGVRAAQTCQCLITHQGSNPSHIPFQERMLLFSRLGETVPVLMLSAASNSSVQADSKKHHQQEKSNLL